MADGECVVLSGDARESQHSECKNRVQLSGSGREVGLSVRCACADQSARVLRTQNLDLDERNFSRPCFKVVVGAAAGVSASANNNHCHCPVLVSSPSSLPLAASGVSTAIATATVAAEKNEMTRRQSCRNTTKWIAAENGRKMRRTSSFDSCESSDSGVAALSSTDSSQSSATSDITEPCSPPSPVTPPRAGTPLPPSLPLHHHHGFHHHHHHHHHHHQMYDPRRGHSPPGSLSPPPSSVESSIAPSPPQTLEPDQETECLLPPPAPFSVEPPATALRLEILHPMDTTSTTSSTARSILGGVGDNVSVLVCDGVSGCGKVVPVAEEVPNKCDGVSVVEEVLKVVEEPLLLPPPPPPPPKPPLSGPCTRAPKRKSAGGGCSSAANPSSSCSSSSSSSSLCRWSNCRAWAPCNGDLMEHLRTYHVEQQSGCERFVCLWEGCKVYNRASCSLSWLERHVLTHGGNKPFKCIVDGCGLRFTTQSGLERHVNGHFNNQHQPTANGSLQRRKEDTPTKMLKKKRLRCFRRRCWTARTEDFFDSGVMECVQHHLVTLNTSTELDMNGTGNAVTFHGSVIARRVESTGKVKVLLRWTPEDVIPDEWVCESQALSHNKQIIRVSNLPEGALGTLQRWTSKNCERRRSRRK